MTIGTKFRAIDLKTLLYSINHKWKHKLARHYIWFGTYILQHLYQTGEVVELLYSYLYGCVTS